jgi:hypothetical protein
MTRRKKQTIEIEKTHQNPLPPFNQAVTSNYSDFLGQHWKNRRKTDLTLTGLLMEGVGLALQLMALESEAISSCAGAEGRPSGVLSMKIALQYCEQASRVYYGVVFRSQKGNSGLRSNRHGPVCPEEFLRKGETIYIGGDP